MKAMQDIIKGKEIDLEELAGKASQGQILKVGYFMLDKSLNTYSYLRSCSFYSYLCSCGG